jgi:hypothetical protein
MGYRRSWENAHSPYWSLHVEAWRRSGLSRTEYCRRHGLKKQTLDRWMKHLIGVEEARKHAEELRELRRKERRQQRKDGRGKTRQRRRFGVRTDARSRAVQARGSLIRHPIACEDGGPRRGEAEKRRQLPPNTLLHQLSLKQIHQISLAALATVAAE